jgi:DNA end-binding protein Ku
MTTTEGKEVLLFVNRKELANRTSPWTPDMLGDPVQAKLLDIIAAKKKGRKRAAIAKTEMEPAPSNVINIMDALKKSIASEGRPKPK